MQSRLDSLCLFLEDEKVFNGGALMCSGIEKQNYAEKGGTLSWRRCTQWSAHQLLRLSKRRRGESDKRPNLSPKWLRVNSCQEYSTFWYYIGYAVVVLLSLQFFPLTFQTRVRLIAHQPILLGTFAPIPFWHVHSYMQLQSSHSDL